MSVRRSDLYTRRSPLVRFLFAISLLALILQAANGAKPKRQRVLVPHPSSDQLMFPFGSEGQERRGITEARASVTMAISDAVLLPDLDFKHTDCIFWLEVTNLDKENELYVPQDRFFAFGGTDGRTLLLSRERDERQQRPGVSMEAHFHDAVLQPGQTMRGWLRIHEVPPEPSLRIEINIDKDRFAFVFGPNSYEFQESAKPARNGKR